MSERRMRIGEAVTEAARAKTAAKVVEKRIAIVWKSLTDGVSGGERQAKDDRRTYKAKE